MVTLISGRANEGGSDDVGITVKVRCGLFVEHLYILGHSAAVNVVKPERFVLTSPVY